MELLVGAILIAAAVLAWRADVDPDAGELERRRLLDRDRRAAQRRRARLRGDVDHLDRLGPRRRREAAAGTRLVGRLRADPTAALDAEGWRRRQDGLRRVHGRL